MNMLFSCINNNSFSFHYYLVIVSFLLLKLVICLYVSKLIFKNMFSSVRIMSAFRSPMSMEFVAKIKLMMNTDVVVSFRGKRKAGLFWEPTGFDIMILPIDK